MTVKQKERWRVGRWRDMRALGLFEREKWEGGKRQTENESSTNIKALNPKHRYVPRHILISVDLEIPHKRLYLFDEEVAQLLNIKVFF